MRARTAIVIGGGIAGPVAAMALQRAGIDATVYEAYPADSTGVGGSLAVAPNGVAALEVIDAADAVLEHALPIRRQVMSFGSREVELPQLSGVGPLQLVNRGDLLRSLHARAARRGIGTVHGARLTDVERGPDRVTARFADGSTATADVLIGADGVHSTVRTLIDPDAPRADYTGLLGFGGVADIAPAADVEPGTMTFAFGRRAYYLYWQRPDGRTEWGANLPSDRPVPLAEARRRPAADWLGVLRETYAGDVPGAALAAATTARELQVVGGLHIMPSVPRWHRGRMVLVGDAVHAPSNSSGQGASLAIESAVEVARCLRDLDPDSGFAAYERLRRERVQRIAARAARINHVKAPGRLQRAVLPAMMRLLLRTAMSPERSVGPEQRFRIDWTAPVAPDHPAAVATTER